ncbi:transposase [Streptomyces sp. BH097]|uniref:transposase n=1 Tax=unclassified Streptomyces TaxID=2593676 RepID=UPI003BB5F5C0
MDGRTTHQKTRALPAPLGSARSPPPTYWWDGGVPARRCDHREVVDAIAFKFQTGTPWVHLPERYGTWRGVHNRLRMWAVDGVWERVFIALVARADADEDVSWAVSVDSTVVHAHQHAAGARKEGPDLR